MQKNVKWKVKVPLSKPLHRKYIWIMALNFPTLVKDIKLQIQKALQSPKQEKHEENHTKTDHNQTAENQR